MPGDRYKYGGNWMKIRLYTIGLFRQPIEYRSLKYFHEEALLYDSR